MKEKEMWDDAMAGVIAYANEVRIHNEEILKGINSGENDLEGLMDGSNITGKIEWVDKPTFKAERDPEVYGVFTLTHVDQWSTGMEGDCYSGFMYVKVDGKDKWLKIPYDC